MNPSFGVLIYEQNPQLAKKLNNDSKAQSNRSGFFTENDQSMHLTKRGTSNEDETFELTKKHSKKTYNSLLKK